MNLQAQMAGQYPRQVTNQAGTSLSSIPQHNIMQNSEGPHALLNMEPERQFIQDRIYKFLMQRRKREAPPKNIMDIVRHLEEGLFKSASTKEEYLNVDTLESRIHAFIKANQNQQYQQRSTANVAMGQMIPTPGVPQSGNSSLMAQSSANHGNNMMMSSGVNQGSFSINTLGSSRSTHHDGVSSTSGQRMMPTPGFNNNTSNQSYVNSSFDSTMVTQPLQMRQQVGDQNSQILHTSGGISSTLAQKSYGFPNESLNGNLTMMGKSSQTANSVGNADGLMTDSHDGISHYQHQGQITHGDGSGNYFILTTSGTSQMNMNSVKLSALQRTSSPMMVKQSNLHNSSQAANIQPSLNQSETWLRSQQPLQLQKHQIQPPRQRNQQFRYGRSPLVSNVDSQIKPESQVCEQFLSSRGSQLHGVDTQNNVMGQPASTPLGQWQSRLQQPSLELGNSSNEMKKQIQNNNNNDNSIHAIQSLEASIPAEMPVDPSPDSFRNQQRWILFLRHARRCIYLPGKCPEQHCIIVQKLWKHMRSCCDGTECQFPRCHRSKKLLNHHKYCKDQSCPVCVPVNDFLQRPGVLVKDLPQLGNRSRDHTSEDSHRPIKRTKIEQPPAAQNEIEIEKENDNPIIPVSITSEDLQDHDTYQPLKYEATLDLQDHVTCQPLKYKATLDLQDHETCQPLKYEATLDLQDHDTCQPLKYKATLDLQDHDTCQPLKYKATLDLQDHDTCQPLKYKATLDLQDHDTCQPLKYEAAGVKIEVSSSSMNTGEANNDGGPNEDTGYPKQTFSNTEKEVGPAKQDDVVLVAETSKTGKPKIKGVSMIELFTPEQVREHITGLRQWVGQSKVKVEKNQAMELSMNENSCQLCAVEKLNFEPPPIYCSPCGARIKRNAMFYTWGSGDTHHFICIPCYNDSRGDTIRFDRTSILKSKLEKKKNDEETEESWVQCDKCEAWQHQVCALFNGRRNDGGQAEYTCPTCYVEEVENGERVPLPQSALLGAKDLPRTILSDHIENRLFKRLRQERLDRARFYGKSYDEVPGVESLVVRVVSSVDKKLEVKQRFLEIFQEENYPSEFGYKSKVVLLFQKIEGVEVCLFGMYVQEFGAECVQPNHRRVYLSYLDSVKYFRPEIRTVSGEALRTFVYHEILIGYLEYCKLRGFTSCYIWACPPLKGEDYILYCHPEIQKTPKSDKLREWYLQMLKKASKENIVVELTNLYDHFFVQSGECKAKVTAARLPYFDGDYWPGAAEDIIYQLQQEEEGRKNRKVPNKRTVMKRGLKASGQSDFSSNASKDVLLMHRLGETISPMKEDFIMVHLQHSCTHCCLLMVSGKRWVCNNCKNFQLCDSCYEVEKHLEDRERHPVTQRMKHPLYPIEIKGVPTDTTDEDEILESEFFDTRQAFLSLCQGNHYQYDTLRRAKHSSMMALYHLHNPTAPAFMINCNICRLDIEAGQGWRCDICPDYDICNACYLKEGASHPHKLTHHPSVAERDAQNKEARQQRVSQLRKMLDLLVHASQCRSAPCPYPNCTKVRGLFRHGRQCKVRASGGCPLCKKMWHLLQLHARACKDSPCNVPRCRDLKEHLRRLNQQADSRRRAAVMEMMRQRAAEVASGSG